MTRKRHWLSGLGSGLFAGGTILLLGVMVALVVIPKALGGMSLTVLTGSMQPTIAPGDMVVTKGFTPEDAANLEVGDVITFLPYSNDPLLVTHRIIAKSVSQQGYTFVTQGDNNASPDNWSPVRAEQIRGVVLYHVPKLGHLKAWLADNTRLVMVASAGLFLAHTVYTVTIGVRRRLEPANRNSGPDPQPRRRA